MTQQTDGHAAPALVGDTESHDGDTGKPVFLSTGYVAGVLGVHPGTVRRWRVWNARLGRIAYGPPYEHQGNRVWYPQDQFNRWCALVHFEHDVPSVNPPCPGGDSALDPQVPLE